MKVIISMSGQSSRFAAAGYTEPKFMIEVDGKRVIEHIVELYPPDSNFLLLRKISTQSETRRKYVRVNCKKLGK